ncbi:MAG: addiction module protein [Planctomycetia bacterium]
MPRDRNCWNNTAGSRVTYGTSGMCIPRQTSPIPRPTHAASVRRPNAARTLSPAERMRLVDAMWDDEHPENWPTLSPEWLAEVQRRSAEFDAGLMKASPWEDVQARVRRKAGLDG